MHLNRSIFLIYKKSDQIYSWGLIPLIRSFFSAHKFIVSRNIRDVVWQQSNSYFHDLSMSVFILFDSFSDLTDFCFTAPSQTAFYCHKSDLKTPSGDRGIIVHGLLDLDSMEILYESLFNNFFKCGVIYSWNNLK